MSKNMKISIATFVSALLFCALIIFISISPLSEIGENANQFNSLSMWASLGMVLFFYVVPFIMYRAGMNWMLFLMAAFNGIGMFIFISVVFLVIIAGFVNGNLPSLIGLLAISGTGILVNIIWFFAAFRKKRT